MLVENASACHPAFAFRSTDLHRTDVLIGSDIQIQSIIRLIWIDTARDSLVGGNQRSHSKLEHILSRILFQWRNTRI